MARTLEDWLIECERRLTGQPKALREAIVPVFVRIRDMAPALLSSGRLTSKKALTNVVRPISMQAETAAELSVTAAAFELLYEYHQALNPDLDAPTVMLPLQPERPLIDDDTPPIGVIACLRRTLYQDCPYKKDTRDDTETARQAAIGQALLIVSFRAGFTRQTELEALLAVPAEDWVCLSGEQALVSAYLPQLRRRVYLMEEAILAIHAVRKETQNWPKGQRKKRLRHAIQAWQTDLLDKVTPHERSKVASLTVAEIIRYIGLLDTSAGVRHLWALHTGIDHATFIRTFVGECIASEAPTKSGTQSVRRLAGSEWQSPKGDKQAASVVTRDVHRLLRRVLSSYKETDPNERRVGAAYANAKAQLESILQTSMPWSAALTVHWICSLFFHGSPWKDKLAVGTLLTYHSTIRRFIDVAWYDEEVIEAPEAVFESCCQTGIDHFENAEEQYTVARFLRFCQQYTAFPHIDLDIFDMVSSQGVVRPHYVPPTMFDDICRAFSAQGGAFEFRITVFMQLCYYAGLREDEALSLRLRDIDFDTGMLYITAEKKRKTAHAVRKVPLALVPQAVLSQWAALIDEQHTLLRDMAYEKRPLFSSWAFSDLETQFIDFARDYLRDGTLVTHSFRHCAANNWACLLAMLAFAPRQWPNVYFTRHALFSRAQLERVTQAFDFSGHRLTPYFPILDWVSEKLGHASPATTWSTYWHLMDWIALMVTATSYELTKAHVRFWTANSNYGFERQKQLFQTPNDRSLMGWLDALALSDWLQSQWKDGAHYPLCTVQDERDTPYQEESLPLAFSQFVFELDKLAKGGDDAHCHPAFIAWLRSAQTVPAAVVIKPNQIYAWMRLCQQVDLWGTWPVARLIRMRRRFVKVLRFHQRTEITQYRELHCLLSVYSDLKLTSLSIKVSGKADSASAVHWQALIKRFGAQCIRQKDDGRTRAAVKPYRLHWPLWSEIRAIMAVLLDYLDWLIAQKPDEPILIEERPLVSCV